MSSKTPTLVRFLSHHIQKKLQQAWFQSEKGMCNGRKEVETCLGRKRVLWGTTYPQPNRPRILWSTHHLKSLPTWRRTIRPFVGEDSENNKLRHRLWILLMLQNKWRHGLVECGDDEGKDTCYEKGGQPAETYSEILMILPRSYLLDSVSNSQHLNTCREDSLLDIDFLRSMTHPQPQPPLQVHSSFNCHTTSRVIFCAEFSAYLMAFNWPFRISLEGVLIHAEEWVYIWI